MKITFLKTILLLPFIFSAVYSSSIEDCQNFFQKRINNFQFRLENKRQVSLLKELLKKDLSPKDMLKIINSIKYFTAHHIPIYNKLLDMNPSAEVKKAISNTVRVGFEFGYIKGSKNIQKALRIFKKLLNMNPSFEVQIEMALFLKWVLRFENKNLSSRSREDVIHIFKKLLDMNPSTEVISEIIDSVTIDLDPKKNHHLSDKTKKDLTYILNKLLGAGLSQESINRIKETFFSSPSEKTSIHK